MPTRGGSPSFRGHVFGLLVESDVLLPISAVPRGDGSLPRVSFRTTTKDALERDWPTEGSTSIVDWRSQSGRCLLSIDRHVTSGYRIKGASQGVYRVSADGCDIAAAPPTVPAWRWQRFLFAQVMPLAAALQGLSPFHASAVVLDGRAIGFAAESGSGKTSVAAYLAAHGASFVTDDVLALEATSLGVRAHPGPGLARIGGAELRLLKPGSNGRLGEILGHSDKVQLAISTVAHAVDLGAMYYLERGRRFEQLRITEISAPDPVRLLASSFVSYVDRATFQQAHLATCHRLATSVDLFGVSIPEDSSALETASAIASHARA